MRKMGILLAAVLLCGCTRAEADTITAIVREEGSGTRAAFGAAFDLTDADIDPDAVVTNSTSVVKLSVAGNPAAAGYLSVGALDESVRALAIDGISPSPNALSDGSYPVMRTLYLAAPASVTPAAADFLRFIAGVRGQTTATAAGFIPQDFTPPPDSGSPGRLVIAGSSSAAPLLEALRQAYLADCPDAAIEIQISDSSTGAAALAAGICDLAMLSRTPAPGEGETAYAIARDALAVIVHPDNPTASLTSAQVRALFSGKAVSWLDLLSLN